MTDPARQQDAARPRLRMRLSLRWKAFCMLLLLLGAVHAFYGVYTFRQAIGAFTSDERERMQRSRQMFDGLLLQSAQSLGRIAAQLAASISAADLVRHPLDEGRISPELLASLSALQVFDGNGQQLGGFSTPGGADLPEEMQTRLLATVRRLHRPASTLWCGKECALYVFEPVFDHDGREILVGLSQPASELLTAFSRQSGIDVALLSERDTFGDSFLKRHIYAITNAPTLLPRLRAATAGTDELPTDRTLSVGAHGVSLMLLLAPLSLEGTNSIHTLFISDESPALARIGKIIRDGVAISLGGLLLSGGALWWFLTPLSHRLGRITRALPLLADKRFNEAAAMLGTDGRKPRLADELDLLNANARWLTQRLKQLDNAEAASAAKSRFLATLSHEVRTPLNGILGLLEVLQHSRLDPAQRESLGMVHDSAQSLLGILDDTIDLARIEAGRIDIVQAPFSIEQVVAGCAETAAPRARAKGLRLLVYADPALPPRVMGDALRLRQVLNNLCSNAVKFTASGHVVVRAELAGRSDSMLRVRFSILDSGIGIATEHQQSLFQPFQQGDSSTTARYGGSGLGLSICQGLVRRMGGRIGFISNPGTGSEFSFWLEFAPVPEDKAADAVPQLSGVTLDLQLPDLDERAWVSAYLRAVGVDIRKGSRLVLREDGNLDLLLEEPGMPSVRLPRPVHRAGLLRAVSTAAGRQERPPPPPASETPLRCLRILAVDDHPTNREVIQRQLSLLGHRATTAADAQQALGELGIGGFDLLLTDLRMPGMDGVELVRAVRELERSGGSSRRLPAIVLSAQLTPAEKERCLAAGMDACLAKPLALDALREALAPWTGAAATGTGPSDDDQGRQQPVFDRAVPSRLLGGDENLVDLIVEDFLKVNTPLVPTLIALGDAGDCEGLVAAAHRLLGSARTVGAAQLVQALSSLEEAARQEQRDTLPGLAAAAAQRYEELQKVLEQVSA